MDKRLNIEYMDVDDLIPYINNPRENDNAVDKVASSIESFGFKNPIIIDSANEIIAGHTRLKAAIGYEYEESEIKANKKDNTTEVKKVKKHKQPDVRAAIAYLNLFCK